MGAAKRCVNRNWSLNEKEIENENAMAIVTVNTEAVLETVHTTAKGINSSTNRIEIEVVTGDKDLESRGMGKIETPVIDIIAANKDGVLVVGV